MLPLRYFLLALACSACALPAARAHSAGESSLILSMDEENLAAFATLSLASASTLLPAEKTPPLSAATFDQNRKALLAAAARVCSLLDADGAVIAPARVLVSLRDGHEVHFDFFYPDSASPAQVRVSFLSPLSNEAYCEFFDQRKKPAQHTVLHPKSPALTLSP